MPSDRALARADCPTCDGNGGRWVKAHRYDSDPGWCTCPCVTAARERLAAQP